MQDRTSTYPGRVKLTLVPGQVDLFDMERADDPSQKGTPLNKSTLLTDATAALLGLSNEATVNDMLAALAATTPITRGGSGQDTAAKALYAFINGATALTATGLATGDYIGIGDTSAATGKKATITDLASFLNSKLNMAKIAKGSYVGTGTYGSANPCSLTFDFEPKVLLFSMAGGYGTYALYGNAIWINGDETCLTVLSVGTDGSTSRLFPSYVVTTWDGQFVSWYSKSTDANYAASYQLNYAGQTYSYVAIG